MGLTTIAIATMRLRSRDAKAVIPPRKDAGIWQHGNCKAPAHPRDENRIYELIFDRNWVEQHI